MADFTEQTESSASKEEHYLTVEEIDSSANHNDNSMVYVHPIMLNKLQSSQGDTLLLRGANTRETVVGVLSFHGMEIGSIRMNQVVRKNLRVDIGDSIAVSLLDHVPYLKAVQILPFEDTLPLSGNIFHNFLAPYFQDAYRPLRKGDLFTVQCASNSDVIEFKVLKMDPSPYGIVGPETTLYLEGVPIKREDVDKDEDDVEEKEEDEKEDAAAKHSLIVEDSFDEEDLSTVLVNLTTLEEWNMYRGDVVILQHEKYDSDGKRESKHTTVACVSQPKSSFIAEGKIGMNKVIRKNLRVNIGDSITLSVFENIPYLDAVQILPLASSRPPTVIDGTKLFENYLVPYFKDQYRPIYKGDLFTVRSSKDSNSQMIEFKVLQMNPFDTNCGIVGPETTIYCDGEPLGSEHDVEFECDVVG